MKNKQKPMYDGRSREKKLEYDGKNVLRYKMPDASTSFKDLILGDITVENKELDDFIRKHRDDLNSQMISENYGWLNDSSEACA